MKRLHGDEYAHRQRVAQSGTGLPLLLGRRGLGRGGRFLDLDSVQASHKKYQCLGFFGGGVAGLGLSSTTFTARILAT